MNPCQTRAIIFLKMLRRAVPFSSSMSPVPYPYLSPVPYLLLALSEAEGSPITYLVSRLAVVFLLQLAQFAPAGVLLGLGGVGVFFAFEPKAEPIYGAALRSKSLNRILQLMCAVFNIGDDE